MYYEHMYVNGMFVAYPQFIKKVVTCCGGEHLWNWVELLLIDEMNGSDLF